ncbi:MAG: TIGR03936 family radical SAM-associated protein, partial [Clostridia bacterium]|nr:TIGR03936 family radical SAM-associated protein [Clostridia bacterium]
MNKYLIKFSKIGNMKYISHLDLMNVFQRVFRRAGIQLVYSQGFSPHPKISIAHPLSLGIESIGEYMEFELVNHWDTQELLLTLNKQLPKGIGIMACKEIVKKIKSLAAEVRYAAYDLSFSKQGLDSDEIKNAIQAYLNMDEIIVI